MEGWIVNYFLNFKFVAHHLDICFLFTAFMKHVWNPSFGRNNAQQQNVKRVKGNTLLYQETDVLGLFIASDRNF